MTQKETTYLALLERVLNVAKDGHYGNLMEHPAFIAIKHVIEGNALPTYRHKKRGTYYTLIGQAEVQSSRPIVEGDILTVYLAVVDESLWTRPVEEFNDGRFEQIKR